LEPTVGDGLQDGAGEVSLELWAGQAAQSPGIALQPGQELAGLRGVLEQALDLPQLPAVQFAVNVGGQELVVTIG